MQKFIIILLLTISVSTTTQAIELLECNLCKPLEMNKLARTSINNGEVIVYNPSAQLANKYRVKTEMGDGIPLKVSRPIPLTTGEQDTLQHFYHLYSELGAMYKSFVTEIDLTEYAPGSELANLTAYDVLTTSAYNNQLSTFINNNVTNFGLRIELFNAVFTAMAKAIENYLSDVLSMTVVVKFSDGSQLAYELSIANGNMAALNRESSLNRDSEGQDLINSNSRENAGIYRFTGAASYNNFRNAATLWGVRINGDQAFADDDEITVRCYWSSARVLTCIVTKNP